MFQYTDQDQKVDLRIIIQKCMERACSDFNSIKPLGGLGAGGRGIQSCYIAKTFLTELPEQPPRSTAHF